jgi:excisionase family DNA binding protein
MPVQMVTPPSIPSTWLPIRAAAAFLGVSESALRAWADAGVVSSHRTPGGHRRFLQTDLTAMLTAPASRSAGDIEGKALSLIRRRMAVHGRDHGELFGELTEAEKVLLREQGRRLVGVASEYLAKPKRRYALAQEAFEIGTAYGLCLRGHDVSLSRAMDTFVFFRNLVADTADGAPRIAGTIAHHDPSRLLQDLLDQVMRGLVQAYERRSAVAHLAVGAEG